MLRFWFTSLAIALGLLSSTVAPAGAAPGHTVAYVGGSITRLGVVGAHAVGETGLWESYAIGGGTVLAWHTEPYYFSAFDQELAQHGPPSSVWFQLAFKDEDLAVYDTDQERLQLAVRVLKSIRARVGPVPVYVSAMAEYQPSGTCPGIFKSPLVMDDLARALVRKGFALAGPTLPPLQSAQLSDGCHQNEAGQRAHGQVLQSFFP
jgi:hypothetical protein